MSSYRLSSVAMVKGVNNLFMSLGWILLLGLFMIIDQTLTHWQCLMASDNSPLP